MTIGRKSLTYLLIDDSESGEAGERRHYTVIKSLSRLLRTSNSSMNTNSISV